MSDLPWGWTSTTLGVATNVVRGITFPATAKQSVPTAENVCCLRTANIQKDVDWRDIYYVGREYVKRDEQFVQAGDTLMSMANSYELVGKVTYVKLVPFPTAFGAFLSAIRPTSVINGRYLFHFLRLDRVQLELREGSSQTTNIANISAGKLSAIEVPLAPVVEQTRIADQLDTLLARIQACNDRLDAIPGLLKRFRQAVLKAACSGSLTEDWRAPQGQKFSAEGLLVALAQTRPPAMPSDARASAQLPPIPQSWRWTNLQFLLAPGEPFCYGVVQPGVDDPHGVPLIRAGDLKGGTVLIADLRRISAEVDADYKRSRLQGGELLVTVVGAGIGEASIAPPSTRGFNIARAVAKLPIREVSAQYVHKWLQSSAAIAFMKRDAREVARPTLNLEELKSLPVPLPPLEEQSEIVHRVEALFKLADRIEARHAAALSQAQRLTPLILAKAFRGELVQQDPNDEPASVLLQRIAATPTATVKASRGRPRSKPANQPAPLPTEHVDWAALPAGAWAAGEQIDEHATAALLIAVLKAWGQPMPQDQARLAAMLCLQPRLFTAALPAHDAAPWRRLVGAEAEPLPASVAALQPAVNTHWRRALAGLRARGDLVTSGSGPQDTWSLGPGADRVDTAGWPDGRAGWVVAHLRAHGVEAVLPLLPTTAVDFVHAHAA